MEMESEHQLQFYGRIYFFSTSKAVEDTFKVPCVLSLSACMQQIHKNVEYAVENDVYAHVIRSYFIFLIGTM